jgi:hypothetical protein
VEIFKRKNFIMRSSITYAFHWTYLSNEMVYVSIGMAYSTHRTVKKCIQQFRWNVCKEKVPYGNEVWAESEIILKTALKFTLNSAGSGNVLGTGCCEHGNESSSSINIDELLTTISLIRSLFHLVNVKNILIILRLKLPELVAE